MSDAAKHKRSLSGLPDLPGFLFNPCSRIAFPPLKQGVIVVPCLYCLGRRLAQVLFKDSADTLEQRWS